MANPPTGGGGFGGGPGWISGLPPAPPAADPMSLLQMAQTAMGTGDNPYGGRSLAQTVIGGLPYNMNVGADGRPIDGGGAGFDMGGAGGGGFDANAWLDRPATNENVSEAIQRGGQYRPEVARTLQSSGQEGGWFSIPGSQVGGIAEASIPWGYYPSRPDDNATPPGGSAGGPAAQPNRADDNPAPGLFGMSTNNWRLLPYQFRDPKWAMRAGHIIDRSTAANPGVYVAQHGSPPETQALHLGSGGHGYPLSFGRSFGPRASFFPGQIEPWIPEGGPGGMGTGIY